ncbi:MarR family winged helix-turn-helix transcriptional regulator [Ensifer soli]|uniref:MarR family winged helix-turn-helix transcriptional regulator n=1 Tax=Ciceribacter sp. sgz301302 TaxID=3342379 RepID=UPI0035B9632D
MSDPSLNRSLMDEFSKVNRKLRALFDARVKERGLTLARARALFRLSAREACNQRELADDLEIETPTIVRLLDGMERQGFIERRSERSDRRIKQIHLTDAGRRAACDIENLAASIRAEVVSDIPEDDIRVALRVVRAMGENLQAMARD